MPAGDRTGPRGMGLMTGRGMGYCRGYDLPGYANLPAGRGFGMGWGGGFGYGRGRGWGRGWGRGFDYLPPPSEEDEAAFLRAESARLKRHLEDIEKRLGEVEKED